MKNTEKYQLQLIEPRDLLSPKTLNENTQALERVLDGMETQILRCVRMASGCYTGNGAGSVVIQTPGMEARVVLMRKMSTIGASSEQEHTLAGGAVSSTGWALWRGEDIAVRCYTGSVENETDEGEGERYSIQETTVRFSSVPGNLTWSLAVTPEGDHSALINNERGTVYEWIAFGFAAES